MNKTTFKLFLALLTGGLFLPATGHSQISYSQDFETLPEDTYYFFDFEGRDEYAYLYYENRGMCDGWGMVSNLYVINPTTRDWVLETVGVEFIGVSDGSEATLSYKYKIMDTNKFTPMPNSFDWGKFTIGYSTEHDGEYTIIETIDTKNHIESLDCATRTISFTPPAGDIYIQIKSSIGDKVSKSDISIMFDDFNVFQQTCADAPAVAATLSNRKSACTTDKIELSLPPVYKSTGLTYQWQSSANGDTFTNLENETKPGYSTTQSATTWYRAQVTCVASGKSVFTTPTKVTSTGLPCYCEVLFYSQETPITLVNFAGINNSSTNVGAYSRKSEDFTSLAPAQVFRGKSYPIIVEGVTSNIPDVDNTVDDYYSVFIDFNHNGILNDDGEVFKLGLSRADLAHIEGTITIPEGAKTGKTFMRVFKAINGYSSTACSTTTVNGVGQAEDYFINIKCIEDIEGEAVQQITEKTKGTATIADIDVTPATGATVVWYATQEEALAGSLPLSTDALLVTGTTYYAVQTLGECKSEVFAVTITTVLGTQNFTAANFKYYPNPVTNVLNLSYNKNITGVQVYNLLGQQVLAKSMNQNEAQLNLTNLAAGTYLVKVSSDDALTSFKVVKQ